MSCKSFSTPHSLVIKLSMLNALLVALSVGGSAALRVPAPRMRELPDVVAGMGGATFAAVGFALLGVAQEPFENPDLLSSALPLDHVYAGVISVVDQLNVVGAVILPLVVAQQVFAARTAAGEEAVELNGLREALDSRGEALAALASDGALLDHFLREWSQLAHLCDTDGCAVGAADEGMQCLEVERDDGLQWVCI